MAQTGIIWGGWNKHLRVGFNFRWTDIGAGTTTSAVFIDWYVDSGSWGYQDQQTLNWGGAFGGTFNYTKSGTGAVHVYTTSLGTFGTSYGGGPSWSFNVWVTGAYDGSAPSASWTFTLPARPPSVPSPPGGPSFSNVTASNLRVTVAIPANNGAGIVEWQFRRALNGNYSSGVVDSFNLGNVHDLGGLTRATNYFVAVRCRNAVGWSGWSATGSRSTLATVPDKPTAAPVVETILPDSLSFSWKAPVNGGSAITGYDLQVSTSSAFTTATTVSTTALKATASGLMPATAYFARYRAKNAVGAGAWSATQSVDTLSGTFVKVAGEWRVVRIWVKVSGAWVQAKAWKKEAGTWRL